MLLYIKVKPNQSSEQIELVGDGWQVKLKAPAIDGKANKHLVEFISKVLKIPKSSIILKKGHRSRLKCLEIDAEEAVVIQLLEQVVQTNQ